MTERPPTRRLFFALWPPPDVRDAVLQDAGHAWGRSVPPERLHLTLVFLGPVSDATRACVEARLAGLRISPFSLELDHTGWWPRPRVSWAAPSQTPKALVDLVEGLRSACRKCELKTENRPYRAHLTLARKVNKAPPSRKFDPIVWPVDAFTLVESRTLPGGAEYRILNTWRLLEAG